MREILFRGFHECTDGKTVITVDGKEKRGVWVYGFYTYCTDGDKLSHRIYISFAESYGNEILCPIWFEALPSTVGQFTGLTDKNGKKIFEGDIVSDGVVMYTVEFHSSAWFKRFVKDKSAYSRLHYNANCLEIIGNIFGNSDLIGGNENA